ncbi:MULTISPECIES: pentapeptide repeat-containing protein [Aerosakkonema]|uniref:pentapeptide repeat-containing protein n=1 Tax=Aerosakkonema TaxID=1246629 RepID=UPI0035BB62D6
MADPEVDLALLVARIDQMEQQQKIVKRYVSKLKRRLDNLTEQFNNRPELQELECLRQEFGELQLHLNGKDAAKNGASKNANNYLGKTQELLMSVEEFVKRYEEGELDFIGVNLAGANLRRHNLSGLNLSRANLSKSDLSEADLISTNLSGANLSEANLERANLKGANIMGANLRNAKLKGAIMPRGVIHV